MLYYLFLNTVINVPVKCEPESREKFIKSFLLHQTLPILSHFGGRRAQSSENRKQLKFTTKPILRAISHSSALILVKFYSFSLMVHNMSRTRRRLFFRGSNGRSEYYKKYLKAKYIKVPIMHKKLNRKGVYTYTTT